MQTPLILVLLLLAATIALLVRGRPRMDVVALLVVVAFPLSGILTPAEALAGFSDPNVILIAALFVIGEALVRTGIAFRLGNWLAQVAAGSETRLLVLLMLTVAGLGSVMSSTGVVAIFIPVLLRVAARMQLAPGRLMMPLAFAGLISGMLTLVATPPNMVIHAELQRHGLSGFGFFTVTPIGLTILLLAIGYMLLVRRLLQRADSEGISPPQLTLEGLSRTYRLNERERRLRVLVQSPLCGQELSELALRKRYGLNLIGVERRRRFTTRLLLATGNTTLEAGDVLLVDQISPAIGLLDTYAELGLAAEPLESSWFSLHAPQLGLAEVAFPPESRLLGKTIQELGFRRKHGLNVVGLKRAGVALQGVLVDERLKPSDTLLVAGEWKCISRLQGQAQDFLVLSLPAEAQQVAPALRRAPHALAALALMVALMISGVVPNVLAALIGCLLMGAFRCVDMDSALRSIHWPTLLLIVGMLPFATALQKTGGIDVVVQYLVALLGSAAPHLILACLFAATALVGLFISNTATAVLMAPVAIATAKALAVSPLPFALIVALAASSAFMTPLSSPVNTLVLGPGRYRFADFVRIGVPFTLLVMLLCVFLVPWLAPL